MEELKHDQIKKPNQKFFHCEISQGKDHTVSEKEPSEDQLGMASEMLHISNVSLNSGKKTQAGSKYKVFVQVKDQNKALIANLMEGGLENYALDLYFDSLETPKFTVEGKGGASVSITGYWESSPVMMDDYDDYGMSPMDMEALEEEEADLDPNIKNNIDIAKKNALKNSLAAMEDDDSEDEEDEPEEFEGKSFSIFRYIKSLIFS